MYLVSYLSGLSLLQSLIDVHLLTCSYPPDQAGCSVSSNNSDAERGGRLIVTDQVPQ